MNRLVLQTISTKPMQLQRVLLNRSWVAAPIQELGRGSSSVCRFYPVTLRLASFLLRRLCLTYAGFGPSLDPVLSAPTEGIAKTAEHACHMEMAMSERRKRTTLLQEQFGQFRQQQQQLHHHHQQQQDRKNRKQSVYKVSNRLVVCLQKSCEKRKTQQVGYTQCTSIRPLTYSKVAVFRRKLGSEYGASTAFNS